MFEGSVGKFLRIKSMLIYINLKGIYPKQRPRELVLPLARRSEELVDVIFFRNGKKVCRMILGKNTKCLAFFLLAFFNVKNNAFFV